MKKYVEQLVADIRAAKIEHGSPFDLSEKFDSKLPFDKEDELNMMRHFEEVEEYVAGRGARQQLVEFAGLQAEAFPPAEKLTDLEMATITEAMLETLLSHGISFDMPTAAPAFFRYQLLFDQLREQTIVPKNVSGMFIGIDFCTGDSSSCELKEYCNCLKKSKYSGKNGRFDEELTDFEDNEFSKNGKKLIKKFQKAGSKYGRKDNTFRISIYKKHESLSKKSKPIFEWLKINMDVFGEFYGWDKNELRFLMNFVQQYFPKMDWSWLEFTDDFDTFDMTTALLEVRADFDKNGHFTTTRRELFWFLQLGDRMMYKKENPNRDNSLPF